MGRVISSSCFLILKANEVCSPVLVNVSSFRCIIGFALSFRATAWIEERGFLGSFGIYAGVLGGAGLLLPIMYFYGKRMRQWTAGTVRTKSSKNIETGKGGSYMEY